MDTLIDLLFAGSALVLLLTFALAIYDVLVEDDRDKKDLRR